MQPTHVTKSVLDTEAVRLGTEALLPLAATTELRPLHDLLKQVHALAVALGEQNDPRQHWQGDIELVVKTLSDAVDRRLSKLEDYDGNAVWPISS
jgi:hypothetical protein